MTQKNLAVWLKILIIGVGIAIPLLATLLFPTGSGTARLYRMLFWCIAAIPPMLALVFSWQIASGIAEDRSFSLRNALLLRRISVLAAIDGAYLTVGASVRFLFGADTVTYLLLSFTAAAVAVTLSIAFAALSHLVRKAAALQRESDLTV